MAARATSQQRTDHPTRKERGHRHILKDVDRWRLRRRPLFLLVFRQHLGNTGATHQPRERRGGDAGNCVLALTFNLDD